MPVIAIAGDHLVAGLRRELHADDDRFLADIEMTEPADEAHAVHLPGLLLEAADEQHFVVGVEILVLVELGGIGDGFASRDSCLAWTCSPCGQQQPSGPPKGFLDESCSAVGFEEIERPKRCFNDTVNVQVYCVTEVISINSNSVDQNFRLIFVVAEDNDEIAAVHTTEHDAGALLEQITVDLVAAQECDATVPIGPLGAHDLEFVGEILRLRFIFFASLETARAAMGMMHEIPHDRC